jgi:hypothetical protein
MATPGILSGGAKGQIFRTFAATETEPAPTTRLGVFGINPGSTAKYAINRGPRDAEYAESMARMFIELPKGVSVENFKKTISAAAQPLADVLVSGTGTGGSGGTGFVDFLLTSANENFQEKAQITDTLTDNYVAFYSGQEPPLFQYTGVLLNTYQDDQRIWMLRLYREILRGTKLASRNLIMKLRYDSFIVSGYMETLALGITGETEHTASQFSFTMRVKRMTIITPALGSPTILETAAVSESAIKKSENSLASTLIQRVGITSPEVPPTATTGPAVSSERVNAGSARERDNREMLRQSGLSDTEIEVAYLEANFASENKEFDSRELSELAAKGGADRVAEQTKGTTSNTTNPQSATNDGAAGTTNVMGALSDVDPNKLVKAKRGRARGARTI